MVTTTRPFCKCLWLLQHGSLPFSFRNVRARRYSRSFGESSLVWGRDAFPMGEARMTIYRLLGELEISHEGPLVKLPGGPTLVVLAALLVNANRRMSKTELIRAAWGNDEVSEAQLYKRVMAVRDLLTKIGRRDDLKAHPQFGYEIRIPDEFADTLQFQQFVRKATEAGAYGRTDDEVGFLRRALEL